MQIIKQQQRNGEFFQNSEFFQPVENTEVQCKKKKTISIGPDDNLSATQKRVFPKRYLYAYDKTYASTTHESFAQPITKKVYSPAHSPVHSPMSSPRTKQRKKPESTSSSLFTSGHTK